MKEETRNWREELELEEMVENWYDEGAVEITPSEREGDSVAQTEPAIGDVITEMAEVVASLENRLDELEAENHNPRQRIKDVTYDFEDEEVVVSLAFKLDE